MEQKEGISELEKQKWALIDEAKRIDRLIFGRKKEKEALEAALSMKKEVPPVGRLRKEIDDHEFKISTEAFTRKNEQEMLKKLKQAKAGLEDAIAVARMRYRLQRILAEMPTIEKQRQEVEAKIAAAKAAVAKDRHSGEKEHYKQQRQQRHDDYEKRRGEIDRRKKSDFERRRDEDKKEMEKYMAKDEALELGQIATIIKKKKKAAEGGETPSPKPASEGAGGAE